MTRVIGGLLIIFGFLISLSIVGAIFGIPMILIGFVLVLVGGRHKTTITNVVQVSNVPGNTASFEDGDYQPPLLDRGSVRAQPRLESPVYQRTNAREPSIKTVGSSRPIVDHDPNDRYRKRDSYAYDRDKWDALVDYDPDLARLEDILRPYGQKYIDQLASAYLALNDKDYLPMIMKKIVATAREDAARR
jgi:hypothetical protein